MTISMSSLMAGTSTALRFWPASGSTHCDDADDIGREVKTGGLLMRPIVAWTNGGPPRRGPG
jgi:hypothetical protein